MKKTLFTTIFFIAAMTALNAQQISVVASNGNTTTLYSDLNLAIQGASAGSTIYLSGGGFQVADSTKITKRLTIIGIGHRPDNDNADGSTIVSGNFSFEGGADNSAVMGIYLSGNINIGTAEVAVNTFLVRYCNINSIQVLNSNCLNVTINQNYIRNTSDCRGSAVTFTNNILHSIYQLTGGVVDHNVIRYTFYGYHNASLNEVNSTQIKNNIIVEGYIHSGGECPISNNMTTTTWGDNHVNYGGNWDDVFEGTYSGVNVTDNYALKNTGKNAATDGSDIGIYGGSGFSDTALPPVPRIVTKIIPEQTDENGKLNIQLQIKAK